MGETVNFSMPDLTKLQWVSFMETITGNQPIVHGKIHGFRWLDSQR